MESPTSTPTFPEFPKLRIPLIPQSPVSGQSQPPAPPSSLKQFISTEVTKAVAHHLTNNESTRKRIDEQQEKLYSLLMRLESRVQETEETCNNINSTMNNTHHNYTKEMDDKVEQSSLQLQETLAVMNSEICRLRDTVSKADMKGGMALQQQGQQEATIAMIQARVTAGLQECNNRAEKLGIEMVEWQQNTRRVELGVRRLDSKINDLKTNKQELALNTLHDQTSFAVQHNNNKETISNQSSSCGASSASSSISSEHTPTTRSSHIARSRTAFKQLTSSNIPETPTETLRRSPAVFSQLSISAPSSPVARLSEPSVTPRKNESRSPSRKDRNPNITTTTCDVVETNKEEKESSLSLNPSCVLLRVHSPSSPNSSSTQSDEKKQEEELSVLCVLQTRCSELEKKLASVQNEHADKLEGLEEWKRAVLTKQEEERTQQKQRETWIQQADQDRALNMRSMCSLQRTGFGLDISHQDIMDTCTDPTELNALSDRIHAVEQEVRECQASQKIMEKTMQEQPMGQQHTHHRHDATYPSPSEGNSIANRVKYALKVEFISLEKQLRSLLDRIIKNERTSKDLEMKIHNNSNRHDKLKKRMSSNEALQTELQNCLQIFNRRVKKLDNDFYDLKEMEEGTYGKHNVLAQKFEAIVTKHETYEQVLKFFSSDVQRTNQRVDTVHERLCSLTKTIKCFEILSKSDEGNQLRDQLEKDEKLLLTTRDKEVTIFQQLLQRHQTQQHTIMTNISKQQEILDDLVDLQNKERESRVELRKQLLEDKEREEQIINSITTLKIKQFDVSDTDDDDTTTPTDHNDDDNAPDNDEKEEERKDNESTQQQQQQEQQEEEEGDDDNDGQDEDIEERENTSPIPTPTTSPTPNRQQQQQQQPTTPPQSAPPATSQDDDSDDDDSDDDDDQIVKIVSTRQKEGADGAERRKEPQKEIPMQSPKTPVSAASSSKITVDTTENLSENKISDNEQDDNDDDDDDDDDEFILSPLDGNTPKKVEEAVVDKPKASALAAMWKKSLESDSDSDHELGSPPGKTLSPPPKPPHKEKKKMPSADDDDDDWTLSSGDDDDIADLL